jgi:hypothetical protein
LAGQTLAIRKGLPKTRCLLAKGENKSLWGAAMPMLEALAWRKKLWHGEKN